MLGLPDGVTACLFDMDGVVTKTAVVHAAAWKQMFDEFLRSQPGQAPFDSVKDYDEYVDGKPRLEGTESFLESRHINLPDRRPVRQAGRAHRVGPLQPEERAGARGAEARRGRGLPRLETVHRRRPQRRASRPRSSPPAPTPRRCSRRAGWRTCSTSASTPTWPRNAGCTASPPPTPSSRPPGCSASEPANAAVFEDALAGVAAGRAGKFGLVVGVDRVGQADELREHGADVVVKDLADLL